MVDVSVDNNLEKRMADQDNSGGSGQGEGQKERCAIRLGEYNQCGRTG